MKLKTECLICHQEGEVDTDEFAANYFTEHGTLYPWTCSTCNAKLEAEKAEKERQEHERERVSHIEQELDRGGLPKRYRVKAPPVPYVSQWMQANAGDCMLLAGETGTGKSTSAGYLARTAVEKQKTFRYFLLSDFLDQWRTARRDTSGVSTGDFLARMEACDLLILDEASGDKNSNTDSTRECMFRLLEDVYSGRCRACVVFLGNYYRGSIAEVFGNEDAARRRLSEAFLCGRIDPETETVNRIQL